LAGCIVTNNPTGILASSSSMGTAAVIGTSPGTNLIAGNMGGNVLGAGVTLQ
jgi:hypothetical protein